MRLHNFFVVAAVTATLLGLAPAAHAQTLEPPRARQGYYASVGIHALANYNREDGKGIGTWFGSEFMLRLGQMVTRRFGLGLQIDLGSSTKGTEIVGLTGLGVAAQWELVDNLALHGGLGLGVASVIDQNDKHAERRGTAGSEYFLGISYDWVPNKSRLTGGWAIIPMLQGRYIPGDDFQAFVAILGLQLGYWSGLPRNQLELPESDAYKR
jgi:opacity protein-like surface antigen